MRQKHKILRQSICIFAVMAIMSGCSLDKRKDYIESIDTKNVMSIIINTNANDVWIEKAESQEITIMQKEYEDGIAKLEESTLTIEIPSSKAGIRFTNPTPLYVYIPSDVSYKSISIESESGNIYYKDVNTSELDIRTEVGAIELKGIEGVIKAKSNVGKIYTTLFQTEEIKENDAGGNTVEGVIGNKKENEISVYTNTGKISMN